MKKKLLALIAMAAMVMTMIPAVAFAGNNENAPAAGLDVSKSKEATQLEKKDGKYESTVTLSLPSAERELVTDIVFVLDKSTSADLEDQALKMLSDLKKEISESGAKVKVGVVIFNKEANVTNFQDLETQYDRIKEAIMQKIESGTNTHAGLIAGKEMLDEDTTVPASRKYMIFVSDGITYMFNNEEDKATAVAWQFKLDRSVVSWAAPENWESQYGDNKAPDDWEKTLSDIEKKVIKQGDSYDYAYGGTATNYTDSENQNDYANSVEKALYLTAEEYQAAKDAGYNCYAMTATQKKGEKNEWGPSFMNYLADGKTVDFTKIYNDIVYLVDEGSTVEDYMGYVENDYNFDLKDLDSIKLTVGGVEQRATIDKENNSIYWGDKEYILTYHPANDDKEFFEFKINTAVKISEPVQLSYKVVLQNPKTAAGTYGVYDQYGANNENGLYTNNSAVLTPVDTQQITYQDQAFPKPTVSYTVSGGTQPSDTPSDKPSTDGSTSGETKTGDDSNMMIFAVLMAVAAAGAAGVVVSRRRHN